MNGREALRWGTSRLGINSFTINKEVGGYCLAVATCIYRFGLHGVRSAKNIRGALDIGTVSATENEDRFKEMDAANTMSQTGWQKLVDAQVFSDPMTEEARRTRIDSAGWPPVR